MKKDDLYVLSSSEYTIELGGFVAKGQNKPLMLLFE